MNKPTARLVRLAELIKKKNAIDGEIAAMVGRPAQVGHVGEYIAAQVFGIELNWSASQKGIDGYFTTGSLMGRSVNIKWYGKHEGLLDLTPEWPPDYYLVLAGPRSVAGSSRGAVRPWVIESMFLFDARSLIRVLQARGIKLGVATSVIGQLWNEAEVYPVQRNSLLTLSDEQRSMLELFR
jgi:hypothetical protein